MKKLKIVITGGPGTGKSSIIHELEKRGEKCLHEISRDVILEAKKEGIDQLFLEDPILFSRKLLEGRIKQFHQAEGISENLVFIDRGIPDVVAYMEYLGTEYSELFVTPCVEYKYTKIFLLPPWQEIYLNDNERYENFNQAKKISAYLYDTYKKYGYQPMEVPKLSVKERTDYILNTI
ncbi:ATP-binding protein [Gramella sp. AN32]|uniref:AAA family ATPase n=1 Tax=Christiangramia antarctica TaxID=2058158 RepID=A0ABW5XCT7_9FLAO|nr:ATPase [Gramella sp. AN32]